MRRGSPTLDQISASRLDVAVQWIDRVGPAAKNDARLPATVPGYFIDRFAFARCSGSGGSAVDVPGFDLADCLERRDAILRDCGVPIRHLADWVVPVDDPATALGDFYSELLYLWRTYCVELGLPGSLGELADQRNRPWRDLYDDSVFFPRAPVFSGPRFFDALGDNDREYIVRRFGPEAPIEFFCLMHQVHEGLHRHQTGEPLVNEIVVAALWVRFLDIHGLWCFQQNSVTGRACVQELGVVRSHPDLLDRTVAAGLDTMATFREAGQGDAYVLACWWAAAFDLHRIRYRQYLDGMAWLLMRADDYAWVAEATSALRRSLHRGRSLPALQT